MSVKKNLDYIIVLGAHVDGTRMTLALLERARRALLYLEENPGTRAVLSGGKGDGENISEAEAMYRYLIRSWNRGEQTDPGRRVHQHERKSGIQPQEDRNHRLFHRRGDQQFSCMERSSYCKEMRLPGSCYGTFQISKLASSGLHSKRNSGNHQG